MPSPYVLAMQTRLSALRTKASNCSILSTPPERDAPSRHWAKRWRGRWGIKVGVIRPRDVMPAEEMRDKALLTETILRFVSHSRYNLSLFSLH